MNMGKELCDIHQWHQLSFVYYNIPCMTVAPGFCFVGCQYNTCIVPVVRMRRRSGCPYLVVQREMMIQSLYLTLVDMLPQEGWPVIVPV